MSTFATIKTVTNNIKNVGHKTKNYVSKEEENSKSSTSSPLQSSNINNPFSNISQQDNEPTQTYNQNYTQSSVQYGNFSNYSSSQNQQTTYCTQDKVKVEKQSSPPQKVVTSTPKSQPTTFKTSTTVSSATKTTSQTVKKSSKVATDTLKEMSSFLLKGGWIIAILGSLVILFCLVIIPLVMNFSNTSDSTNPNSININSSFNCISEQYNDEINQYLYDLPPNCSSIEITLNGDTDYTNIEPLYKDVIIAFMCKFEKTQTMLLDMSDSDIENYINLFFEMIKFKKEVKTTTSTIDMGDGNVIVFTESTLLVKATSTSVIDYLNSCNLYTQNAEYVDFLCSSDSNYIWQQILTRIDTELEFVGELPMPYFTKND